MYHEVRSKKAGQRNLLYFNWSFDAAHNQFFRVAPLRTVALHWRAP
jgi:hypothetical protein